MRPALEQNPKQIPVDRLSASQIRNGQRISVALTVLVLVVALMVLVFGWMLDLDKFLRIKENWPAMVPATAGGFVVACLGVLHWRTTGRSWAILSASLLLLIFPFTMPDRFFSTWLRPIDGVSTTTQVEFVLCGVGMLALAVSGHRAALVVALTATAGLMHMNVALAGYFFYSDNFLLEAGYFARLSLPTTFCFLVFHCATLLMSRVPLWVHILLASGPGSQLLRVLLPTAVVGPAILGQAAYIAVTSGHAGVQLSIAVLVVVSAWLVIGALFIIARWINSVSQQEKIALEQLHRRELALSNAEALAARMQTSSSLGRVSGGVAHEFNNLLSIIQGNLELLRETPDTIEREQFLLEALNATGRGAGLTQKLLSYGEKSVLNLEDLNLDQEIETLRGLLRRVVPARILFVIETKSGLGRVHVDCGRLEQAVISLVTNATESIREYGRIDLRTGTIFYDAGSNFDQPKHAHPPGRYHFVSVEDTGCGVADGQIDRITEPFYSTKSLSQSSGLGLSMVHGFCKQSGGFLECQSTLGLGSRFTMYFPECTEADLQADVPRGEDPFRPDLGMLSADKKRA